MTPRSFFVAICKLAGLYFILQIFLYIPAIMPLFSPGWNQDTGTFIFIAFVLLIYVAFCRLLLFRGNWIVDIQKLDNHFEEEVFTFNMRFSTAAMAALTIIGVIILINEIPHVIQLLYTKVSQGRNVFGKWEIGFSSFIVPIIKIVIALLIIGERKRIADYLNKSEKIKE